MSRRSTTSSRHTASKHESLHQDHFRFWNSDGSGLCGLGLSTVGHPSDAVDQPGPLCHQLSLRINRAAHGAKQRDHTGIFAQVFCFARSLPSSTGERASGVSPGPRRVAEAGQKAEWLSWAAGVQAIVFGIIVAILTVRAINQPLRRLTEGTHALAKGQFWHRLPAYGGSEFSELARNFNTMAERLGELDQMKKDFVSHVSHDLKAPLASIRPVMHLLLQEIPGSLNDQQKSLLRLSYNSAERLAAMVGNLLDLSRMEAGTMEYEMAARDLMPLIQGVIDEFEVQAHEKGIRLKLESDQPSVSVECDKERIMQVIGNLLENALKFSLNHGEIVTRVTKGSNGSILTTVTDSGPGVPDDHKRKIFRKFHQVKQGKKMAGQGVGLGLAICKTIVEAHQGEIWVEDNPGGGSIFSFILQAATVEEVLKCRQSV